MSKTESMRILKGLEKSKQFWFAIFTAFLFFLLRLPSLFEPLWYGDEGIYQVIGNSLNHGKLLYSQVFDNKPPFLYWVYAIFQSDQFTIRLVSLIFGVLSVAVFFLLSKRLFENKKSNNISYLTTFVFAVLFGLPVLEGNIANAENFMLLPILTAALIISNLKSSVSLQRDQISNFKLFAAGILLGIAFLFKIVAIFDLSAFLVFYFILNFDSLKKAIKLITFPHKKLNLQTKLRELQKALNKISKIFIGFFLPIFLIALFFITNGTFVDFVKAVFLANVSYVNYGNKIGSLPLLLFIKLALLGGFLVFVLAKRKKINHTTLFISIWFAFSLFNAFFSQRPYTHYLLVLIPSLSLMIGLILFDKKYQKITAVIFLVTFLIVAIKFGILKSNKGIHYYQNFISYVMNGKTSTSYQAFFDRNTPFDYEIARFIKPKLNTHDTIFLWGNNAQLYQLIGVTAPTKYVVAYHITNYKDGSATTQTGIKINKPKFIVVMSNAGPIPFPLINYSKKIDINNASIYERIF